MRIRKSFIGVAILLILFAVGLSLRQRAPRPQVQLIPLVHTNEAGVAQSGWFMLSNPAPHAVLCIPHSVQTLSPTGWTTLSTMSATNDPFTYDLRTFSFDRVLTQRAAIYFSPTAAISNQVWRVSVNCIEKSMANRWSDQINSLLSKNSVRTYGGRSYQIYSSPP